MARSFLIRGMLCGLAAGILVFLFARFFGEPSVDGAIAVEEGIARAAGEAPEPELVSRAVQASWGL
ncbi:MAG: CbtA family protein, partial [Devosia sp.]